VSASRENKDRLITNVLLRTKCSTNFPLHQLFHHSVLYFDTDKWLSLYGAPLSSAQARSQEL